MTYARQPHVRDARTRWLDQLEHQAEAGQAELGESVNSVEDVRADASQGGSVCTDMAPTGGIAVPLGFGSRLGGFTGSWRTRCPGPSLTNAQPLLGASLDRSMVGHRQFTIQIGGKRESLDDGYAIFAHGRLSLVLRRGRITQQVTAEPTD